MMTTNDSRRGLPAQPFKHAARAPLSQFGPTEYPWYNVTHHLVNTLQYEETIGPKENKIRIVQSNTVARTQIHLNTRPPHARSPRKRRARARSLGCIVTRFA